MAFLVVAGTLGGVYQDILKPGLSWVAEGGGATASDDRVPEPQIRGSEAVAGTPVVGTTASSCTIQECESSESPVQLVMSGFPGDSAVIVQVFDPSARRIAQDVLDTDLAGDIEWWLRLEPDSLPGLYLVEVLDIESETVVTVQVVVLDTELAAPARGLILNRGAPAPFGYWYSVTLVGFDAGEEVTLNCSDGTDQNFYAQSVTVDSQGTYSDATLCYSGDEGPYVVSASGLSDTISSWSAECPPLSASSVLRGELAYALWVAAGQPTNFPISTFEDVPSDAFYAQGVSYLIAEGISTGTRPTAYSPDHPVTRAQAVTFLWRYAGSPPVDGSTDTLGYKDISPDSFYGVAAHWGLQTGTFPGPTPTEFQPNILVTHEELQAALAVLAPGVEYFTCPTG